MNLNKKVIEFKQNLVEDTQKILRIKSVQEDRKPGMPFGEGISDALETMLSIGKGMGFSTKNLDGYIGYIEWGEGEEIVGVLGHLDVVPEGDRWSYPPYGAEIHDGKIYARGALDDKGPIMSALYGMLALKEDGFAPKKRIRIILGTNEETGSEDVEYYLKNDVKPSIGFTPDADFPIIYAEKGLTVFNITKSFSYTDGCSISYIKGGQRANMVPDYCEIGIITENKEELIRKIDAYAKNNNIDFKHEVTEQTVILKSIGLSAHGSTPEVGKNAIMQAIIFLNKENICSGEVGDSIRFLAEKIGLETRGESFGVCLQDEVSGYLSFNVGTIEMNENRMTLSLNLRYPVTKSLEDMMKPFEENLKSTGFEIEDLEHQKPLYFSKENKLIKILSKVYEEQTGEKAELLAIGGGTYAKEMPNIVAFGPIFPGKPDLDHQPDEYIEVEDLVKMTQIYAHAIKELTEN
jgi:succinyl-diaminopimelate desuccinylase